MTDKPDFEALRAERNANVEKMIDSLCRKLDLVRSDVAGSFNPAACYCACPDGPCEHDWQGRRDFEDGSGSETFCSRCGLGCMSHDLRVLP